METILPPTPGDQQQLLRSGLIVQASALHIPTYIRPEHPLQLQTLFSQVVEEWQQEKPGWMVAANACLQTLLALVLREAEEQKAESDGSFDSQRSMPRTNHRDLIIAAALAYIHQHYMERISASTLAVQANLSVSYFITRFKKYTGLAPGEYITRIRTTHAKKLIRQGELTFSQIADLTGFDGLAYFSRMFKKVEGLSPSEYRVMDR